MAVALQQEEIREVKGWVDGVLGCVIIAALRLFLFHAKTQHFLVGFSLGILSERTLLGLASLLAHRGQIHLAEAPPDAESICVFPTAVHKQGGHSGAGLLQLTSLGIDPWVDKKMLCHRVC